MATSEEARAFAKPHYAVEMILTASEAAAKPYRVKWVFDLWELPRSTF
jgi:hypothetical protein